MTYDATIFVCVEKMLPKTPIPEKTSVGIRLDIIKNES